MSEGDATKPCPFCGRAIQIRAVKCRFCGECLDKERSLSVGQRVGGREAGEEALKWLVPVGRSGWAIASGYLGLFSCFPFIGGLCGIAAVVTGILALRACRQNSSVGGKGRAIFGIVLGTIAGLANLAVAGIALYAGYKEGWK